MSRKRVTNSVVADALRQMALYLEMDDVRFKPQAYEKAAAAVAALERPLAEIHAEGGIRALEDLPGVGKGIAGRMAGMLKTGRMADLEKFRRRMPVDLLGLTAIEGIGAKKARALWKSLGVRSVADLRRAAEKGRLRELAHFGERSERRILTSIGLQEESAGRRPLGEALALASRIEAALANLPGVERAVIAGSIRRRRDTIGDVDILVAARQPERVSRAFESLPEVQTVLAHGPTKTLVRLGNGIDADLRVLSPESFGAALLYFTGSKAHCVALRRIAQKKGLKLNEYGLFRGRRPVAAATEEAVYAALGLPWIPPEIREDTGEIERARAGELPRLIAAPDIRGDLQIHTNWTDGTATIAGMARAARELGREYIVISDHTHDLAMTGGLDARRLRAQMGAVRKADRRFGGLRVLAGAEVNIRPDGSLDIDDGLLAELDVVGAAVHSHFDQPRTEMTRRIVRAIENPHVDLLLHPLGRLIGQRRGVDFDVDAVIAACRRTGTVLEVDARPERLDLPDTLVRRATAAGVRIAIDSDAHAPAELAFIEKFGISAARRGWAEKKHVINALSAGRMLAALKRAGKRADSRVSVADS
jgi:DNA polymerase (family 10)